METFSISTLDLIIVFAYMVFIVWWGLKNGKSQDSQSYFLAGRSMPWWVVGAVIICSQYFKYHINRDNPATLIIRDWLCSTTILQES